jgi:AraC-like DNA-binding protein
VYRSERILPSGTFELVINLAEDEIRIVNGETNSVTRYDGAVISGSYDRFFAIDSALHAAILGVHFRPAGASRFFGLPANAVGSRHLNLSDLYGTAVGELRERLCTAARTADRFRILEDFLTCRVRAAPLHAAIRTGLHAIDVEDCISIRDIVRSAGLSHRRFTDLFARTVGLTPKLYARVRRFQRIRASVCSSPRVDWGAVAASRGYADQAHLCHDFTRFSGLTPGAYWQAKDDPVLPNHVAR